MARIRTVKPEFYSDTTLADLSIVCRYFYIGLFCQMDRQGVTVDNPKFLKREVFPYDDDMNVDTVRRLIDTLVESGRLIRFTYDNREYLYCPTFTSHQHFHKDEKHRYQIPSDTLLALCKHRAPTMPDRFNASAKPPDSGYLDSGDTEDAEQVAETSSAPSSEEDSLLGDELTRETLDRVKRDVQLSWVQTYQDSDWIRFELRKAVTWCKANPRRAPKTNYATFFGSWLSRGWEQHRKTLNSSRPTQNMITITRKDLL